MFPTSLNNNHHHRVCSFGMIRIRINAPWPLGLLCIKGTKESLPKEIHPQRYYVMWSHLMELSDTGWTTVQQSPISFQRQEKPGLQCTALFKTTTSRKLLFTSHTYINRSFVPIETASFVFPNSVLFSTNRKLKKLSYCRSVTKEQPANEKGWQDRWENKSCI